MAKSAKAPNRTTKRSAVCKPGRSKATSASIPDLFDPMSLPSIDSAEDAVETLRHVANVYGSSPDSLPQVRKYLADAFKKIDSGKNAASSFKLQSRRGPKTKPELLTRDFGVVAAVLLLVRKGMTLEQAKRLVAKKYNVSESTIDAALYKKRMKEMLEDCSDYEIESLALCANLRQVTPDPRRFPK